METFHYKTTCQMIKYILSIFFGIVLLLSCQPKAEIANKTIDLNKYPHELQKVLAAHGGLDAWSKLQSMTYEIVKEGQNEKQLIDLQDRRERIEAKNFTMGYDGSDFWLEADTTYKGNPIFYKNLMFYFYAMPFVIADEGINYGDTPDLTFDGITYPGIRISYNSDIGVSPEDEYFVHYNPDTYQMEWLGYTVTYYSKEKSTSVKWIRYNDWATYDNLVLPKSLAWYTLEEGQPITERNRLQFADVIISKEKLPASTFQKTEGAKIVEEE